MTAAVPVKSARHKHFQLSRFVIDCSLLQFEAASLDKDKITKYHIYSGRKVTSEETSFQDPCQQFFLFFHLLSSLEAHVRSPSCAIQHTSQHKGSGLFTCRARDFRMHGRQGHLAFVSFFSKRCFDESCQRFL